MEARSFLIGFKSKEGLDCEFGMDIHWIEAWTQNRVMEQNLMEDSFERLGFFSQVLRVLRLGIWPRWCIWDGHPCARSLDTK